MGRGKFGGKAAPIVKYRTFYGDLCKTAEPIDLPFGSWTQVGRRKHKFSCIRQVDRTPMLIYGTDVTV